MRKKFKKKDIDEIINSDGELIGGDDSPNSGSNLETQANNTTDYNAKIGHQPYRYDMLGRFGFTLLPFFEGVEGEENKPNELINELAKYMYNRYMEILEYYYRNPEKLKSDFRKKSEQDSEDNINDVDYKNAEDILEIIKKHFGDSLKELDENLKENIDENSFIEGKMLDKKDKKSDVVNKKKDNDVLDKEKKTEKIADLINKLDKDDVKKIKNLLETE